MTDQESQLWMKLGLNYDLSPLWTSFNMAMALHIEMQIETASP